MKGVAMEARIYAEDPSNNFLPQSGKVTKVIFPPKTASCRVDSGVRSGDNITTFYDPMIAKLIVKSNDREHAALLLNRKLQQTKIVGVNTNIKFLRRVCKHGEFLDGEFDTSFIEKNEQNLLKPSTKN